MTDKRRKRAGSAPDAALEVTRAADGDEAERFLGRVVALGLPVVCVVAAIIVGFVASVGSALLVVASGALLGTIALLWRSTGVTATSVAGHGTGTYGSNTMKGSGGGSAASTCNPFAGTGNLVGPSGLKLSVVSNTKSQACAVNAAAPSPVTVIGVAKIMSGTGKFKGATGTLSFKGSFSVQSSTAGSSESDAFSATLTGTVTIKKVTIVAVKK